MANGNLDDSEDATGFWAPPAPDDRVWRHPSELALPPPARPRVWPFAAVAILVGGALAMGVVEATERSRPTGISRIALARVESGDAGVVAIEGPDGSVLGEALLFRTDGYAIAAAHLVAGAASLTLVLDGGQRVPGTVVGIHDETDVAVLKAVVDRPMPTVPASRRLASLVRTPADVAMVVAADLADAERLEPSWLGVAGIDGSNGEGVHLDEVVLDSPAHVGGLRTGDVVLAMEGRTVRTIDDLRMALHRWHPGDRVRITYRRAGVRGLASVVLGARPNQ